MRPKYIQDLLDNPRNFAEPHGQLVINLLGEILRLDREMKEVREIGADYQQIMLSYAEELGRLKRQIKDDDKREVPESKL